MNFRRLVQRLLFIGLLLTSISNATAQTLDQYGGYPSLPAPGGATGYWRVEKLGSRWVFVTPVGNAFWMAGVYVLDGSGSVPDQGVSYDQIVAQKYPNKATWANQSLTRMKSWGFNTVGEYASEYVWPFDRPSGSLLAPAALGDRPSWYGLFNQGNFAPGPFKALEDCLNPSVVAVYIGDGPPDVYDPNFDAYVNGRNRATAADPHYGKLFTSPWVIGVSLDDADQLQGFGPGLEIPGQDGVVSPHIGWISLAASPTKASSARYGVTYSDTKVHTKYALRDFLSNRYQSSIAALNGAWGSNYTTFDSAGGWGAGTGLLDEDGRHTAWLGSTEGTLANAASQVITDLDDFLYQYAVKYFSITAGRLRQYAPGKLVFSPTVLNGHGGLTRKQILQAAGQYVDVLQAGINNQQLLDLTAQYFGDKPIVTWEGWVANQDSSLWRYPNPVTHFVYPDQAARGSQYVNQMSFLLTARTSGGVQPIAGFKWWQWSDNWGEKLNWGLVSQRDNAYDGKEATLTAGIDPWGYPTGGEETNYGDILSSVSAANASVFSALSGGQFPPPLLPPDATPPVAVVTAPSDGSSVQSTAFVLAAGSDDVGVTRLDLLLDDNLITSVSGTASNYTWDTSKTNNGSHRWVARAYDAAGNVGQSTTVNVTVNNNWDTQPPTVSITDPADRSTLLRKTTLMITAMASDNVGVTRVEFYVNGSLKCTDLSAPYACVWQLPAAAKKIYSLKAVAYDAQGNVGYSNTVAVTSVVTLTGSFVLRK